MRCSASLFRFFSASSADNSSDERSISDLYDRGGRCGFAVSHCIVD